MTIIDVSVWQGQINWLRVRAAGVKRAIVRGPIGDRWHDDNFYPNWQGALTLAEQGIYAVPITGQSAAAAVVNFLHVTGGDFGTEPLALDVERSKAERQRMLTGWQFPKVEYTAMLKGIVDALLPLVLIEIYTNKNEWAAMTTQPAWAIPLLHWLAQYNDHLTEPDRPAGWDWDLWQRGQVPVDGIAEPVDYSIERVPPMSVAIPGVPRGCTVGGHTQSNSEIIPTFAALAAAGAVPPILLSVEDPGKCVDAKKMGVRTTIVRFMHSEAGEDHDFEAGGSGRAGWSQAKRLRLARTSVAKAFDHMNPTEAGAVDYVQCSGNEWDAQDVGEWLATCDVWALVLDERDNRQVEYVKKNGKPLKLAMGVFNYGTPKTWAMYEAIFSHDVFRRMHAEGDLIVFHEGIAFDQAYDYLADGGPNDQGKRGPNTLEGAPVIADAGLVNFRSDYAMHVLAERGWECAYCFGEWYDGRVRSTDPASIGERIENLKSQDRHMALLGPATRRFFLGTCAYELTNDLTGSWGKQDFTLIFKDKRWRDYCVSVKDRVNRQGETTMPNISDADYAALVAANSQAAAILARYAKHSMASLTNQTVINLFSHTAGVGLPVLEGALSGTQRTTMYGARQALYVGPALENMGNLTTAQRAALIAGLPAAG